MGRDLAEAFPIARQTFEEADRAAGELREKLDRIGGRSSWLG